MLMIKGESVYLRPIRQGDTKSIYEASKNEEISNLIGKKNSLSQIQTTKYYKRYLNDPTRYDFAICLSKENKIIGDVSIFQIDTESKKADFRIVIHNRNLINKGYGTEATFLAQEFVFKILKLNRLEVKLFSHNKHGITLCVKTGFKTEGTQRQALYQNYQYSDGVLMAMIRMDYNYSRPSYLKPSFMTANI